MTNSNKYILDCNTEPVLENYPQILYKLKLKTNEQIDNIIKDKPLCERIKNEDPISKKEFLKKKIISPSTLNQLMENNLISWFSNSSNPKDTIFIFENELATFITDKLKYDNEIAKNINRAGSLILPLTYHCFSELDHDLIGLYLINYSDNAAFEKFREKHNLTEDLAKSSFNNLLRKFKKNPQIYETVKFLQTEKDKLENEVELLASFEKEIIEESKTIGTKIKYLKLTHVQNIVFSHLKVKTLEEVTKYRYADILKIHGVGTSNIKEVQEILAEYNLKLKNDKK